MKKENQRFHLDTLSMHEGLMFESLIYPHNIISETVKSLVFETRDGEELSPMRGYFAIKEVDGTRNKYFINEEFYDKLPLRANDCEELYFKDSARSKSIVLRPLNPTPFKITAKKIWDSDKEFIDMLLPFEHSNPNHWTLHKIVAVMGYVGKVFIGDCSKSEFGKSSIFEVLHSLTKKSPVFQPRSVPGVLAQITGDGNMVFDEVGNTNAETKRCMENFTLQVGGNKPMYLNGALQAKNTKSKYDVAQQSITFLYNTLDQYKTEDEFFESMFDNNKAIDSRLLKLKFEGILKEQFDKDFDMLKSAEDNRMFYIDIAKHLLWMKEEKLTNAYTRRYKTDSMPKLNGRKKMIYDEITWLIDRYAEDQQEYVKFICLLNECINSYQEMIGHTSIEQITVEEEIIEVSDEEKIMNYLRTHPASSLNQIEADLSIKNIDEVFDTMKKDGEVYECQRGKWSVLE